ncbi:MAG: hypothetical protein IH921_09290, partial [Gemmatimonadetes bacterium]|nr:hypothetical protein [Gemmatimonadota bacterium]
MTEQATVEKQLPEVIQSVIQKGIEEIGKFVTTPGFHALINDLYSKPVEERSQFVLDVVLDPDERAKRGITAPEGMVIQRSVFYDGRPTLFCVS